MLLSELGIRPSDLLQLLREDKERSLAELDERIMILVAALARPDSPVTIRYTAGGLTTGFHDQWWIVVQK